MATEDRFKASSNLELVTYLKNTGRIKSEYVFNLMREIDRGNFTNGLCNAYIDAPLLIAHGKTISAPHMYAEILELFADKLLHGGHALVVESRSGYLAACMAFAMKSKGCVVALDSIADFSKMAEKSIRTNYFFSISGYNNTKFVVGNAKSGYSEMAPYNIISVGAAATEIPPQFLNQLAVGGRLVMPVGDTSNQVLVQVDKNTDGTIQKKSMMQVRYGQLTDEVNLGKNENNSQKNTLGSDLNVLNLRQLHQSKPDTIELQKKCNASGINNQNIVEKMTSNVKSDMKETVKKSNEEEDIKVENVEQKHFDVNEKIISLERDLKILKTDGQEKANTTISRIISLEVSMQKLSGEIKKMEAERIKLSSSLNIMEIKMKEIHEIKSKLHTDIGHALKDPKVNPESKKMDFEKQEAKWEELQKDLGLMKNNLNTLEIELNKKITDLSAEKARESSNFKYCLEKSNKSLENFKSQVESQSALLQLVMKSIRQIKRNLFDIGNFDESDKYDREEDVLEKLEQMGDSPGKLTEEQKTFMETVDNEISLVDGSSKGEINEKEKGILHSSVNVLEVTENLDELQQKLNRNLAVISEQFNDMKSIGHEGAVNKMKKDFETDTVHVGINSNEPKNPIKDNRFELPFERFLREINEIKLFIATMQIAYNRMEAHIRILYDAIEQIKSNRETELGIFDKITDELRSQKIDHEVVETHVQILNNELGTVVEKVNHLETGVDTDFEYLRDRILHLEKKMSKKFKRSQTQDTFGIFLSVTSVLVVHSLFKMYWKS